MKTIFPIIIVFVVYSLPSFSQEDPEFPKGFIMHLKMQSGMVTNFDTRPDLFIGGIQLVPQYTIIPALLRGGFTVGGFYTDKKAGALFGPGLSIKLKTFYAGSFGSAANIHLTIDHLWGSGCQQLIGGGIHADLLNKLVAGFTIQHDYHFKSTWLQSSFGIRVSKKKKVIPPFEQ